MVMVYSATRNLAADPYYFVKRQGIAIVIGIVAMSCVILRIDYRKFRDYSLLAYIMVLVLLFGVRHAVRVERQGRPGVVRASRRVPVPAVGDREVPADHRPVRLRQRAPRRHRPVARHVIVALAIVPIGLVQLQPDLGTNMVFVAILVGLLAVAGVKGRYLIVLVLLAVTGVYAVVNLGLLKQYQIDRLTSSSTRARRRQDSGLQPEPVEDRRSASGGLTGAGSFDGPADPAGLRARAAHRLHLHRRGGGARLRRRGGAAGPVRDRDVAHLANSPAGP